MNKPAAFTSVLPFIFRVSVHDVTHTRTHATLLITDDTPIVVLLI